MCFKRVLRLLFCGLLRFIRALTTVGRRVFGKLRWRYTGQINMSGDECEFDSTWEDEEKNKTPRKKMSHRYGRSRRNRFAAKDMQDFRHSCRGLKNIQEDDDDDDDDDGEQVKGYFYNLEFYRGNIRSSPDELYINDFHQNWFKEYDLLEDVHSYIQWLFPIQEPGVNSRAHVLSKKEIMLFRKDKKAKEKLVQSYRLMLDFYGMRLVNESTGEVDRAKNWSDRFKNLDRHTHNNLRITRILKCLGTLGLEHYQAPLVKFFLHETLVKGELQKVKQSALDYFMFTVLDKSERKELVKYAFNNFTPQEHFVWGPWKVLSGQMAHCENKKMEQPTGSISRSAQDQEKRVNPNKGKNKFNKIDHPPKDVKSKEDHQNNDGTAIPNKSTETNSENENEDVEKKKNQDPIACVSDGDEQDELTKTKSDNWENNNRQCSSKNGDAVMQNNEISLGGDGGGDGGGHDEIPAVKMEGEIENKESEDNQKRLNTHDSKDQIEKIETSHSSEEVKSKTDQQNKNEPVIPSKMTEANSVSDDSDNTAPANMSHGHDAVGDSHQTKDGSSRQGYNVEMKEKPEDESEDNQKRLNPHDSKDETEKMETSHSSEEMKSKTDQQNKNEPVIPNTVTEANSVRVSDDIENTVSANVSHGHDAASGWHQTEDGTLSQGNDVDMSDEAENIHKNSENEL